MKKVQEKIFAKIKENNLTLEETAKRAQINIGTLKNILYGKSNGSAKILAKIANALNCSIDDFLPSDLEPRKIENFDSQIFSYCATEFDKFYTRNNLTISQEKSISYIVSLSSLCKKRQDKNLPYDLSDEIIEWVIENL